MRNVCRFGILTPPRIFLVALQLYYNALVPMSTTSHRGRSMKYGVISMKHFTQDLSDWNWLYTAGRCVHCVLYTRTVSVLNYYDIKVISGFTDFDGGCWRHLPTVLNALCINVGWDGIEELRLPSGTERRLDPVNSETQVYRCHCTRNKCTDYCLRGSFSHSCMNTSSYYSTTAGSP